VLGKCVSYSLRALTRARARGKEAFVIKYKPCTDLRDFYRRYVYKELEREFCMKA
jgi:hypothetical protein